MAIEKFYRQCRAYKTVLRLLQEAVAPGGGEAELELDVDADAVNEWAIDCKKGLLAELDGLKKRIELRANLLYLPERDKNKALLQYEVFIHSAQSNEGQLSAGVSGGVVVVVVAAAAARRRSLSA
jgi:hypothetical protein